MRTAPLVKAPTFGEFAVEFLFAFYPDPPPPKPKRTEHVLLFRPVRRWRQTPLSQIRRMDVEAYFREREQAGAAPGTLERERRLLKRLFQAAVDDGMIEANPLANTRPFKTKPRTRVLAKDEEQRLLQHLPERWQQFVIFALNTGLRLSEQLGVRPMDLEDIGGVMHVNVRPETNKTRTGRRVPLRPEAEQALIRVVELTDLRQPDDRYWRSTPNAVKLAIRKAWRAAGIPRVTCHDLRRTFATRCAQAGMPPKHLQMILGHKDINITFRYYVHADEALVAHSLLQTAL